MGLQWKDLFVEAGKAVVILFILERLYLTSNASWLEVRVDACRCMRARRCAPRRLSLHARPALHALTRTPF